MLPFYSSTGKSDALATSWKDLLEVTLNKIQDVARGKVANS